MFDIDINTLDNEVIDTLATLVAAGAAAAAGGAAGGGPLAAMSGMAPGTVPSGIPQPGTGILWILWNIQLKLLL